MNFKLFWKNLNLLQITKADKLSASELEKIRKDIERWDAEHVPAGTIINRLLKKYSLQERWKAERVYHTETKRIETKEIKEEAEDADVFKFKISLSPNACETCRKFTNNGTKIFTRKTMMKSGHAVPPIHPNCYCVAIPHDD